MKLGNVYLLNNGLMATIDFNDSLHFGITVSNGESYGFNYLNNVERWLEKNNAILIKEGDGGYSDSSLCVFCRKAHVK